MIRWLGKKHLTQMTIIEYISGIVLGGVVAIHISSNTYPLLHGMIALVAWTTLIVLIDKITLKSTAFNDFIHGKSKTLIEDGEFMYNHLKHERMTRDELLESLRTRNIDQLSDVKFARLEPSGKLNVRTYSEEYGLDYATKVLNMTEQRINHLIHEIEANSLDASKDQLQSWIEQLESIKKTVTTISNQEKSRK